MVFAMILRQLNRIGDAIPGSNLLDDLMQRTGRLATVGGFSTAYVLLGVVVLYLAYTRVLPMVM